MRAVGVIGGMICLGTNKLVRPTRSAVRLIACEGACFLGATYRAATSRAWQAAVNSAW
jgi:hypothetical protein